MNLNISQLNFATNWTCPSKYGPSKYDWSFANDAWLVSIWWNSSHAIRVVRNIWIRCITFHNKNNKKNGSGFIFPYFLACAFGIRSGSTFPRFLSIGFFEFLAGFFVPGNAHQFCFSSSCLADLWLTDILQCVNKRIFQQSICVVLLCVYVANLQAYNSQELEKTQASLREFLRISYF